MRAFLFATVLCLAAPFLGGCASNRAWSGWATAQGGLYRGPCLARVKRIGQALAAGLPGRTVRFHVLATREVTAYSFPNGDVFLTRGLVDRAGDNEVAAAIAHEFGHLLGNGYLRGPVALYEKNQDLDVEERADAVGCEVLRMHGISPKYLIKTLQLVASSTNNPRCRKEMRQRIAKLRSRLMPAALPRRLAVATQHPNVK